jgi:Domain of unknown function (DUF397)
MEQVDARWRKSSYSGTSGNNCIEAGSLGEQVGVRDSKDDNGAVLRFTSGVWRAFTGRVKASR